jgi:hypothetical protein
VNATIGSEVEFVLHHLAIVAVSSRGKLLAVRQVGRAERSFCRSRFPFPGEDMTSSITGTGQENCRERQKKILFGLAWPPSSDMMKR